MSHCATEQRDLEAALSVLPGVEEATAIRIGRLRAHIPLGEGARVIDIGAAQGIESTALARLGLEVRGVEPWQEAIDVSRQVAEHTGVALDIVHGVGELLPFEDGGYDLVWASSVLEHVTDPGRVFAEAYRVLRPGGGLYFSTTSALSPRQQEIARFPLFPWYPPRARRAIMDWAKANRPSLIANTSMPAYHWFRHRGVQRDLKKLGFRRMIDRWALMAGEDRYTGWRGRVLAAINDQRPVHLLADVAVPHMEYLAIK